MSPAPVTTQEAYYQNIFKGLTGYAASATDRISSARTASVKIAAANPMTIGLAAKSNALVRDWGASRIAEGRPSGRQIRPQYMPAVTDALIGAVHAGDLDEVIAQAAKTGAVVKKKAA